ncbi:MAG: DUF4189 domain-containing protein [Variibacter sp.]
MRWGTRGAAALALVCALAVNALAQTSPPASTTAPAATAPPAAPAKPVYWGAISFTADGSFATSWKKTSEGEAKGDAAVRCAKFGRGSCETGAFSGDLCVALATYIGAYRGRRWKLSYTSGSTSSAEAQQKALARCNDDKRTRGRCQLRTVACADGR